MRKPVFRGGLAGPTESKRFAGGSSSSSAQPGPVRSTSCGLREFPPFLLFSKRSVLPLVSFLIGFSLVNRSVGVWAQWSNDPTVNTPVAVELNSQSTSVACSDGAGGAIIAWMDDRGADTDIYAQRFDAVGNPLWGINGIPICTEGGIQANPAITSDGAGGAIIAWQDDRTPPVGNADLYAQRVDADGDTLWAADGVVVSAAAGQQIWPMLVSDGAGGAIITWEDDRDGTFSIYAQRVEGGAGAILWVAAPLGVPICNAAADQVMPMIVGDGVGGAIITWYDWRDWVASVTMGIYARRVDAAGGLPLGWFVDGNELCGLVALGPNGGQRMWPEICSDGAPAWPGGPMGAIVAWYDQRAGDWDIYAQRVTGAGGIPAGWVADGVPICTVAQNQMYPKIVADGSGGAFITWQDRRSGPWDIFAQHINSDATLAFPFIPDGFLVCAAAMQQSRPKIVTDSAGGAIIAWNDNRGSTGFDIYAQRLDALGLPAWPGDGVPVSTAAGNQLWDEQYIPMVEDGDGGAIISWNDYRGVDTDIYAQNIKADGTLGIRPTVGYWRFEEGSGSTAADSSGYGNTGTASNVDFTDEVPCDLIGSRPNGYGLSFGASYPDSSFVEIPDSPSLRPTSGITVEAWVRPRFLPSGAAEGPIISKGSLPPEVPGFTNSFLLDTWGTAVPDGTRFMLMDFLGGGVTDLGMVTGPTLPLDRWSHVAGTWDAPTGTMRLYINFVQVGSSAYSGSVYYDDSPILIGAEDGDMIWRSFGGEIDEVRISRVPLEPGDMLSVPPSCPLPPVVVVTAPHAFVFIDTMYVDSFFDVQWIAFDDEGVDSLTLEYSIDAGRTFGTIATGEPNDSSYTWLVPDTPSDSCRIRLTAFDASGSSTATETVVYFRIMPAAIASASPSPLVFPAVPVGETTCDTITVRNNGTATMTIAGIYGCGASPFSIDSTMTAHSLPPGDSTRIVVCVTPTGGDPATCDLTIVSNAANSPTVVEVRFEVVTAIGSRHAPMPFRIVSVSPNPFNPSTTLHFTLPGAMPVTAEIFSVTGARIRVLASEQPFAPGDNYLTWDGRTDGGSPAASGVYFIRVKTTPGSKIARVVLLK